MWLVLLAGLNSPSVQSSVVQLSDSSTGWRMSLVDLVTQRQELERARDEVLASTTDRSSHCLLTMHQQLLRWVIFGYADSGMSNTLEVEEEDEVILSLPSLPVQQLASSGRPGGAAGRVPQWPGTVRTRGRRLAQRTEGGRKSVGWWG